MLSTDHSPGRGPLICGYSWLAFVLVSTNNFFLALRHAAYLLHLLGSEFLLSNVFGADACNPAPR